MTSKRSHYMSPGPAQGAPARDRIARWRGRGWSQLMQLMTPDADGRIPADRLDTVTVRVHVLR